MNHVTIGVYPIGGYKVNVVTHDDLEGHIKYNEMFRPGRMLFVDGKYLFGSLFAKEIHEEKIKEWEFKISNMIIDTSVPSNIYV